MSKDGVTPWAVDGEDAPRRDLSLFLIGDLRQAALQTQAVGQPSQFTAIGRIERRYE